MKFDDDLDNTQPQHAPQMGCQLHSTVPCEERPAETSDWHPIKPRIGERNRLDHDAGDAFSVLCGREQCAFERKYAIAVAACPLWK
jgi:hypothetical protein